ncbi:MAG: T9SS C-terminal target domain-containing protein, partial [Balneolaceae bacterium]
ITDEDGDFEDWIELYNAGADTVSLGWYGLSDDYERPFRWVVPQGVSIAPGEFLLIWASGKDRSDPEGELHTGFSIAQEGEEVLLTHFSGERVDEIPPTRIPSDYSYGRYPDGSGDWYFFDQPTPGASNHSPAYSDQASDPVPSHEGGFYGAPFHLSIAAGPGATLHYTLDGSEPGPGDPVWHDSLLVSMRQPAGHLISYIPTNPPEAADRPFGWKMPQEPPYLATVVRVRAFREGAMPSRIVTNTYFVLGDGPESASTRYSLPVVSLVTDSLSLFDHETGIYIPGKRYEDNWFNPPWGNPYANYFYRGEDWERPASFEFFESGGERVLAQDIGIRIHGGMSRALAMKSLRLYARGEYGAPRFEHPFFDHPDAHPRHGERELASKHRDPSYNRLILRNSGQDFYRYTTLFRDAMIQGLVDHLNFDTQSYRPAVVFINGEYWGIMNIRERYDRHYLARAHGIDPDRIDYMSGFATVKEGSSAHFRAYRDYLSQNDITDSVHYAHVGTLLDIDNFIDYNIANIYANNQDWPGNNRDYFRHQTEFDPDDPGAGSGSDGRWRYMLIDTDFSFGHQGSPPRPHDDTYLNMLAIATGTPSTDAPNPSWSTFELRRLLENEQFRSQFINRFAGLLNTAFSPGYVVGHISHYEQLLDPVMEEHIGRWSYPPTMSAWRSHIRVMDYFAENRPHHVRLHMMEQFEELEDTVRVDLYVANVARAMGGNGGGATTTGGHGGASDAGGHHGGHYAGGKNTSGDGGSASMAGGHIRIHDVDIHPGTPGVPEQAYPWTGVYFRDFPVELAAVPAEGFRFVGWMEFPDHPDSVLQIVPDGDLSVTALFEPTGTFADDPRGGSDLPGSFRIDQNYPNPFNNQTVIPYEMPEPGSVVLTVYTIDGRRIYHRDEGVRPAGRHRASLRAGEWASGVYIVRMSVRSEGGRL